MTSTPARPLAYAPQMDGLRTIAVAAVAWSHWAPMRQFGLPWSSGVHLFFVISGYLITAILVRARNEDNRARSLRAFYVRRVLRIFPAFYVTLALAAALNVPTVRDTWLWHAAYLSNVQIYDAAFRTPVSHFWSLAVEEQFYLLWPWFIVFAPRRYLVPGCLVAIAAAPLARLVTRGFGLSELALVLPIGSFDSLGVGALIALVEARATPASWTRQGLIRVLTLVGVPLWLGGIALTVSGRELPLVAWAGFGLVQALAFGALVGRSAIGMGGIIGQLLESRVMVSLGRISYGMYLVHVFAPSITRAGLTALGIEPLSLRAWAIQPLFAGVTIGLAAAMWVLIEGPLNRLKRHFPYHQRAWRIPTPTSSPRPRPESRSI